jgi:hypothetical protein
MFSQGGGGVPSPAPDHRENLIFMDHHKPPHSTVPKAVETQRCAYWGQRQGRARPAWPPLYAAPVMYPNPHPGLHACSREAPSCPSPGPGDCVTALGTTRQRSAKWQHCTQTFGILWHPFKWYQTQLAQWFQLGTKSKWSLQ